MADRAKLAAQLVRCHALLWSVEDATVKNQVRERIRDLERRIAALERTGGAGPAPVPPRPIPGIAR